MFFVTSSEPGMKNEENEYDRIGYFSLPQKIQTMFIQIQSIIAVIMKSKKQITKFVQIIVNLDRLNQTTGNM